MPAEIQVFPTTALGDTTYLLTVGQDAALFDPQRDAWRFLAAAESRGLTVRYVLETHVHNDYLSGALEVRAAIAASLLDRADRQVRLVARGGVEGWFALSPTTDELPSSERLTLPLTVGGDLGKGRFAQR
jgi:glyoxylase-like metal-dependent hydrolase (beta-lactamase superfamily II)